MEELRLALQLFVVFAIYNVCWAPYVLISVIIDRDGRLPSWVYGLLAIFAFWNSAVNILVYLCYNKLFRSHCCKSIGIQLKDQSRSGGS